MNELLSKVKAHLNLQQSQDDALLLGFIAAAAHYAESFQHIPSGIYSTTSMSPTTERGVIMLASHFYECKDGSTAGILTNNMQLEQNIWDTIHKLLIMDRAWKA